MLLLSRARESPKSLFSRVKASYGSVLAVQWSGFVTLVVGLVQSRAVLDGLGPWLASVCTDWLRRKALVCSLARLFLCLRTLLPTVALCGLSRPAQLLRQGDSCESVLAESHLT